MTDRQRPVKVFVMNEYDWWAGHDLASTVEAYRKEQVDNGVSESEIETEDARELTDDEMDTLKFFDPEFAHDGAWTFREELARRVKLGCEVPSPFASTEW